MCARVLRNESERQERRQPQCAIAQEESPVADVLMKRPVDEEDYSFFMSQCVCCFHSGFKFISH